MDMCCVLGGGGLDKNSLSRICTVLLFSQGPIIQCVCVWESVSSGRYTHAIQETQLLNTVPKRVMM